MFRELFVVFALVAVALGSVVPAFKRDAEWEGRVVGGAVATVNQFPHQCSLRSILNLHFCGCSIVNNRWVLSAAHCTISRSAATTRVVVGAHHRSTGGVTHNAASIVNHPNYNANTIANDVCVVQTATVITFNAGVQPIAVGQAAIGGGVTATVSGWGQTAHPGSGSTNLMWLTKQTLTNVACAGRHSAGNAAFIFASSLCAGGVAGQGVCMGDSGGPLITGGSVVGIVSWGIACAQGFPDTYARVSSFRDWIVGHTG